MVVGRTNPVAECNKSRTDQIPTALGCIFAIFLLQLFMVVHIAVALGNKKRTFQLYLPLSYFVQVAGAHFITNNEGMFSREELSIMSGRSPLNAKVNT